MKAITNISKPDWQQILRLLLVILSWCGGSALGCLLYLYQPVTFVTLMRGVISAPATSLGLLVAYWVPFFTAVNLVFHIDPLVCCLLCLVKSFLFAITVFSCRAIFGSGSWLAQAMILFADTVSAGITVYMALSYYVRQRRFSLRRFFYLFTTIAVICFTDYIFIQPLLDAALN